MRAVASSGGLVSACICLGVGCEHVCHRFVQSVFADSDFYFRLGLRQT